MTSPAAHPPRAPSFDYRRAEYFVSASTLAQCPPDTGREVAFVGRSNAGKSSAINTLTQQKSLARTSKTPGRTQLLNFFSVAPDTFLVDLPGFGYAKVPPQLKAKWQKQLELYLQQRKALQGLVLLMDIRHPFKDFDLLMLEWAVQADMPVHILLTKADKLKRGPAKTTLLEAQARVGAMSDRISVQLFSSHTAEGIRELGKVLDGWLTASGTEALPTDPAQADTDPAS